MKRLLFILAFVSLACGTTVPRHLDLYPTVTILPTQTPYIVVETATTMPAVATQKPQISTQTPVPHCFTVSASEAVYLRPAPNVQNYPIAPVPNGAVVTDMGGKSGDWLFVQLRDKQGWINKAYLKVC